MPTPAPPTWPVPSSYKGKHSHPPHPPCARCFCTVAAVVRVRPASCRACCHTVSARPSAKQECATNCQLLLLLRPLPPSPAHPPTDLLAAAVTAAGYVKGMHAPAQFYASPKLLRLVVEELHSAEGGFTAAIKQLANVATLPGGAGLGGRVGGWVDALGRWAP